MSLIHYWNFSRWEFAPSVSFLSWETISCPAQIHHLNPGPALHLPYCSHLQGQVVAVAEPEAGDELGLAVAEPEAGDELALPVAELDHALGKAGV